MPSLLNWNVTWDNTYRTLSCEHHKKTNYSDQSSNSRKPTFWVCGHVNYGRKSIQMYLLKKYKRQIQVFVCWMSVKTEKQWALYIWQSRVGQSTLHPQQNNTNNHNSKVHNYTVNAVPLLWSHSKEKLTTSKTSGLFKNTGYMSRAVPAFIHPL